MAELSTIARPYAEALFDVASHGANGAAASKTDLDAWSALVNEWAELGANAQVQRLIADPKLTDAQVLSVVSGVVKQTMPQAAHNFLEMLVANGRMRLLPDIARHFKFLRNAHESVADANITSAFCVRQRTAQRFNHFARKQIQASTASARLDRSRTHWRRASVRWRRSPGWQCARKAGANARCLNCLIKSRSSIATDTFRE